MSESLERARETLSAPQRRASILITLAAAAFAAVASIVLAGMVIFGPELKTGPAASQVHAPQPIADRG